MEALAMLLLPLVFVQSSLAANSSCAEALHTFLAKVFQILDLEAFSHRSSLPYHAPKKFIFSLSPVPQSMQLRTTNATHKTVFICRSVPTSLDILVSSAAYLAEGDTLTTITLLQSRPRLSDFIRVVSLDWKDTEKLESASSQKNRRKYENLGANLMLMTPQRRRGRQESVLKDPCERAAPEASP